MITGNRQLEQARSRWISENWYVPRRGKTLECVEASDWACDRLGECKGKVDAVDWAVPRTSQEVHKRAKCLESHHINFLIHCTGLMNSCESQDSEGWRELDSP